MLCLLVTSGCAATTNLIAVTSFEPAVFDETGFMIVPAQRPPWRPFAYHDSWGYPAPGPAALGFVDTYFMDPPEATNTVLQFQFDNTGFYALPQAGYRLGFEGPQNWLDGDAALLSTNLSEYRFSARLRVEGLRPEVFAAACELRLKFLCPDDTLQPPDADLAPDTFLQAAFPVVAGSNWTVYSYCLAQAALSGSNTAQDFARLVSRTTELRFGVDLRDPAVFFHSDEENFVYLDDIRLETVSPDRPESLLSIALEGGELVLTWPQPEQGTVRLQSAPVASGPFADVPGAESPCRIAPVDIQRFYRLRQE